MGAEKEPLKDFVKGRIGDCFSEFMTSGVRLSPETKESIKKKFTEYFTKMLQENHEAVWEEHGGWVLRQSLAFGHVVNSVACNNDHEIATPEDVEAARFIMHKIACAQPSPQGGWCGVPF